MARPFMRHNIAQMEEIFAASEADAKMLKALERELRYRKVPRAVSLLAEVQGGLYSMTATASPAATSRHAPAMPAAPPARQPDLFCGPPIPALRVSPATAVAQPAPISAIPPTILRDTTTVPTAAPAAISADDAYKVLKATPVSTWESIEQTRRQLVLQAHPERVATMNQEKRTQVQAEVSRVNAAYEVLRQLRSGAFR